MKKFLLLILILSPGLMHLSGQQKLLTIAESSGFKSTSRYSEVMDFIDRLKVLSPFIRIETLATSVEGRDIPLLVIGNPLPASPSDLGNDNRIVVYIQGNIHAGEVEGKEASLMYARDILNERDSPILKNAIILICPFINPDGNEKISKTNRTDQNGPENGVGLRYNAQSLDINRDGMKAESPEMKGLLKNVFNRWDPSVFMDCHTTNGSYHIEPVTFTWMVNPNGDNELIKYMRDRMMLAVSSILYDKYKVENCFYGEFIDMAEPEKGWIIEAAGPRYISNYFGLRNRLGILNENYVYADYRSRVLGCYNLIRSLMEYASSNSTAIKDLLKKADERTVRRGTAPASGDSFAIEYKVRPAPEKITVKTFEAEYVTTTDGWPQYRNTGRRKDVTVPYFVDYYPVKSVSFPFAYLITVPDPDVLDLLRAHGIKIEKLSADSELEAQRFVITGLKPSERPNQGHYTNTIEGKYISEKIKFPAGTFVIRTSQPLANVAAYLLEPQADDGLVVWNYLDKYLVPQWGSGFNPYPVFRITKKTELKSIIAE